MESRQRWIALLLFVLSTGLYFFTRQRAIYGDGIFFETMLAEGDLAYGQILYLPLVWLVWSGLGFLDISAETALKLVSALAGGTGVALTFLIACRALTSTPRALAAALLLAGLFGYWFHSTATELHTVHAACALVLFLGLIHAVHTAQTATDKGTRLDPATIALLFLGTALTVGSHTSGIALLLPTVYVVYVTRRTRAVQGQVLIAVGAGLLAFAACYIWLSTNNPEMQKYADDHTLKMFSVVTAPETLPARAMGAARELLLFAVPASALVPAGLRVLFHTAPQHAWLLLLWVIAWPLVVLPVGDFAFGSYHMPTLPVQALLAVIAWHGVATSIPRALLTLAVAALPSAVGLLALNQGLGLVAYDWSLAAWAVAAVVLFALARSHTPQSRWLLALPLTCILLSSSVLPPILSGDHIRDRIHAVAAVVGDEDLVFFLADDTVTHHHWLRFFPGAGGTDPRAVNPRLLDRDPALLPDMRSRLDDALENTRTTWLVGDLDAHPGNPSYRGFRTALRQKFSLVTPKGAPDGVFLLKPKP